MIKGMTGFGAAAVSAGKFKGQIEIKSQNHRYLDIVYYLPAGFSSLEDNIRQVITKEVSRGRVTISFKIMEKPAQEVTFNKDVVREYLKYAKTLKKEFGLSDNLAMSDLIRLPGVIDAHEITLDLEQLWPSIDKGLRQAVVSLARMRIREGKSLVADISDVLKRMSLQTKKIEAREKAILKEEKKVLTVDEFLSFQKSQDVNEEIIRLKHYIEEFKLLLRSESDVGKKLDFVAQEMQRETNTIGSKIQDKEVSNAVISLKSKIEKLREQAQNIE